MGRRAKSALKSGGLDPKLGDLGLDRVKPFEREVEARSITDVQIVCMIWVKR